MGQEWWRVLQKLGKHTLDNAAAMGSFWLSGLLAHRIITDPVVLGVVDNIEAIVLTVLLVIFGLQVIYDVLPEKIRILILDFLQGKLRDLFSAKFVFA